MVVNAYITLSIASGGCFFLSHDSLIHTVFFMTAYEQKSSGPRRVVDQTLEISPPRLTGNAGHVWVLLLLLLLLIPGYLESQLLGTVLPVFY